MTVIYNELRHEMIQLDESQERCPRCNGLGYNEDYDLIHEDDEIPEECWVCDGDGYVDWVKLPVIGNWEEYDQKFMKLMEVDEEEQMYWDELYDAEQTILNNESL